MAQTKCPKCKNPLEVGKSGKYKCPECNSYFEIKGGVTELVEPKRSLPKLPPSLKTLLIWALVLSGLFFSLIALTSNALGGISVLLSTIIILPPFKRAYSRKFPIRFRYVLIISFILFISGLSYAMNSYTSSDEYKQSIAEGRLRQELEQERQKRIAAEKAQKEEQERSKKAEEDKKALEKLIEESQSINEEYLEEQDEITTSIVTAKEANRRIVNELETIKEKGSNQTKTVTKLLQIIQVVDGDTIKVSELGTLRIIGIDTPETVDPRKPVQCFGSEATQKANELLNGKRVRLEFDNSQGRIDKYGRTLAYVYREDGLFFNLEMVKQGYAHEYTYSSPYKYQSEFKKAQSEAQSAKRGLWSGACKCEQGKEVSRSCTACNQATTTKTNWDCSTYTEKSSSSSCSSMCSTATPVMPKPSSPYTCNCSKTCTQITTCAEAQYQLNVCGCKQRDQDKDGIACDGAPLNCQKQ